MPRSIPFLKKQFLDLLSFFGYSLHRKDLEINTDNKKNGLIFKSDLLNSDNPVIFDIGAYVGNVANRYLSYFPKAKIYCFEPFSDSYNKLTANMKDLPNVSCHNIAFSEKAGKFVINSNSFAPTNSLLETDSRVTDYWKKVDFERVKKEEVDTCTLDEFCEDNGIKHIDILKIDVQGMEYSVLEGAKKMLESQEISIIYLEIIIVPTYVGQRTLKDYFSLFESLGYEFLNFYNPVTNKKRLLQADFLFVSSSFKKDSKVLN